MNKSIDIEYEFKTLMHWQEERKLQLIFFFFLDINFFRFFIWFEEKYTQHLKFQYNQFSISDIMIYDK